MLIDDYLDYQIQYEGKYGPKTIILMQVGGFFEAYAIDNDEEKTNAENLHFICDFMNIQISRKNKNNQKITRSNPLMAGFPLLAIDKFIQILLNNKFTVVLIEQVTPPPEPERKVTNIFSPGTNITYCLGDDSSNLVSVYIEGIKDIKNYKTNIAVGLSVIDLTTGKSVIYETIADSEDNNKAYDEIFRFINSHNPKEIIINVKDCPMEKEKLLTYLEIRNKIVHYFTYDEMDKNIFKLSYQKVFLEKVYKKCGLLSVHEYLDLENKYYGLYSFISLLQFSYEHNERVIDKLDKPEIWESNQYLILTSNSINQLDLVNNSYGNINSKYNSLLGIVNNASTAIGKRFLKDKLLNPIINVEELNQRYNFIEELLNKNSEGIYYYKQIEESLNKILDIERLHRRLTLKQLQPADFTTLDIAYHNILAIMKNEVFSGKIKKILLPKGEINYFTGFIKEYNELFDLNEINKYHQNNITNSFFQKGKVPELDTLQEKLENSREYLYNVAKKLSYYIEKDSDFIKIEHNDKEGYYLQTTKKRGEIMKKSFSNIGWKKIKINQEGDKLDPSTLDIKFLKDRTKITSEKISNLSHKISSLQDKVNNLTLEKFLYYLEYFSEKYGKTLSKLSKFVGEIDFYKSNAKSSIMFGYNRPQINESLAENSYLDAIGIRHPIIERIQTDIEYVTNDICLGIEKKENKDCLNGMLLYGCNAVGKSSLMKAVGLNLIMAQAGMFVPSAEFIYKPFSYIFTRISDNDNIFKGQSSFAVEMSELRSILKRSDANSIVLGDELCSGTESVSAQSIFASSVIRLASKKVNFIFATHLHELYKMELIKNLANVKSFHLKVIFDEENKKLIYDRKLESGNGPAIYGLEVCKAMDLDKEFLELANSIRKNLLDIDEEIVKDKTSQYNKDLYMDKCEMCGKDAEETHHIKEQQTADENNMIGSIHKNTLSNIVPLCKKCHNLITYEDLDIKGYIQTSLGKELDFNKKKENKKSKKKYTDTDIKLILSYNKDNMSMKKACLMLAEKEKIKISSSTLKKVWLGQY